MAMQSTTRLRAGLSIVCFAALMTMACGGSASSPTSPTQATPPVTPAAPPATPPVTPPATPPAPTTPASPGRLAITITPNPVPWSNEPIAGCSLPNTWRYDQLLENTGGTRLSLSDRADAFDGAHVSSRTISVILTPGQRVAIQTRWCSANATAHVAQTTFAGVDDAGNRINVTGALVTLRAR